MNEIAHNYKPHYKPRSLDDINPQAENEAVIEAVEVEYQANDEVDNRSEILTPRGDYLTRKKVEILESGKLPDFFSFFNEIEGRFDYNLSQDPAVMEQARKNFDAFTSEIIKLDIQEGRVVAIEKVLQKFYKETSYNLVDNSMMKIFSEDKPEANCNAIAKGITACLERLGLDLDSQVFFQFYRKHVRVVAEIDGKLMVLEGPQMSEFKPEDGTSMEKASDVIRRLIGIETERGDFTEPTKDYFEAEDSTMVKQWIRIGLEVIDLAVGKMFPTSGVTELKSSVAPTKGKATGYLDAVRTTFANKAVRFFDSLVISYSPNRKTIIGMGALAGLAVGCAELMEAQVPHDINDLSQQLEEQEQIADNMAELIVGEQQEIAEKSKSNIFSLELVTQEQVDQMLKETEPYFGTVDMAVFVNAEDVNEGTLTINVGEKNDHVTAMTNGAIKYLFGHELDWLQNRDGLTVDTVNFVGETLQFEADQIEILNNIAEEWGVEVQFNEEKLSEGGDDGIVEDESDNELWSETETLVVDASYRQISISDKPEDPGAHQVTNKELEDAIEENSVTIINLTSIDVGVNQIQAIVKNSSMREVSFSNCTLADGVWQALVKGNVRTVYLDSDMNTDWTAFAEGSVKEVGIFGRDQLSDADIDQIIESKLTLIYTFNFRLEPEKIIKLQEHGIIVSFQHTSPM